MTYVIDKLDKLIEEKKQILNKQKGDSQNMGSNYSIGFIDGLNIARQAVIDAEKEFTQLVWLGWIDDPVKKDPE